MSTREAFLQAICETPEDDTPRLVFADWLEEQGEAERAEFIRTQVALAGMAEDDPRRVEMEVRERHLLAAHAREWAAPWPPFTAGESARITRRAEFRRGFVETVQLEEVPAPAELEATLRAHPVRALSFEEIPPAALAWLAGPEASRRVEELTVRGVVTPPLDDLLSSLRRLRRLTIEAPRATRDVGARWLRLLAGSRLEALHLDGGDWPGVRFLQTLAKADLPALRDLTLDRCEEYSRVQAVRGIIRSALWPRLRMLDASGSEAFPWAEALAGGRLRCLRVPGNDRFRHNALADALASFTGDPTLEELEVEGFLGRKEVFSRALASGALAGVRRLTLSGEMTDDDLQRLARSPILARLERLSVTAFGEGGNALEELFGSPNLGRLTHLTLFGTPFPPAAGRALARNPSRSRLRVLEVLPESAEALVALTEGEPYPELHTLSLLLHSTAGLSTPAVSRLTTSAKLPRLCVVDFRVQSRDLESVAAALRASERLAWAGGVMYGDIIWTRVSVKPEGVYLPDHLAG
jgi:uncharacterized protein (TIGR02996 family)